MKRLAHALVSNQAKRARPPPEVVAARRAERKAAKALAKVLDPKTGYYKINKRADDTQRFAMRAAYDGQHFHGWQKLHKDNHSPDSLRTVESVLEMSIRPYLCQKVRFIPSGRTDAKVSAKNQMIQFDISANRLAQMLVQNTSTSTSTSASTATATATTTIPTTMEKPPPANLPADVETQLMHAFNTHLPGDVRILHVARVPSTFNVMKPKWKRYKYVYPTNDLPILSRFLRHSGSFKSTTAETNDSLPPEQLPSLEKMQKAASMLVGTHDFGSYQSSNGRATTVRTVHDCTVDVDGATGEYVLSITSNGFLMHMVRIVAGTVLEVGTDCRTMDEINKSFVTIDRKMTGVKLPGLHLHLDWVEYDTSFANIISSATKE